MIEAYLQGIDALLSASSLVRDVEIVRRTIRDTEFEKVLHYRYRVLLANGDFIEMTERVLEAQGRLEVTKYRHHWQDRQSRLLKRWDNAPHYPAIDTFPHHLRWDRRLCRSSSSDHRSRGAPIHPRNRRGPRGEAGIEPVAAQKPNLPGVV